MYSLRVKGGFAAAHHLEAYKGKCENTHGHNWKVELTVSRAQLHDDGMLLDFHDLKRVLGEVIAPLDHSYINKLEEFSGTNPTSENIARFIFDGVVERLQNIDPDTRVHSVAVKEAEGSVAVYSNEDL